ncbi:N-acetylneuraminate synthase family protein [Bacteroidota bacterium]
MKTFIIAEIGINHNGNINIAKKLIDGAIFAGANAVKFQKRSIEKVYSQEELTMLRESPFGNTNRDLKKGLEFEQNEYDEIDSYCKTKNIHWLASAWDIDSQLFLNQYNCKYNKVASAMLTHRDLLQTIAKEKKHTFISTGMSTLQQIKKAIKIFNDANCPFELMHCNSSYPMPEDQANLLLIPFLKEMFNCNVGYSGHEVGLIVSVTAAAIGATSIERHITLDRAMYGSDQAASIEIMGFHRLVKYIKSVELALGQSEKIIYNTENQIKRKLRKIDTL